jgi:NADPH:quinone reductase|tara:strand:- start:509 stop:1480 length:972 start_codon:yes stop_codon:yes gene_type:complete
MKAITFKNYGDASVLEVSEVEIPEIQNDEVLIKVKGAGINRPDIIQRAGFYPPPKGTSDILGLEVSGVIVEVGKNLNKNLIDTEVCALLTGGGYAEYAKCNIATVLPAPKRISLLHACTIPETFFTVWTNLFDHGNLRKNESLLVHGGASGIGLTALSIAKQMGVKCFTTVGTKEKKIFIEKFNFAKCINYNDEDFEIIIKELNKGIDVILDIVGGEYFQKNINLLNKYGRLINIAYLKGSKVEVNLLPIMLKRLIITGSTLRIREDKEKKKIADSLISNIWPLLENGEIQLYIDKEFDYVDVKKAHEYMENNKNIGKLLLKF